MSPLRKVEISIKLKILDDIFRIFETRGCLSIRELRKMKRSPKGTFRISALFGVNSIVRVKWKSAMSFWHRGFFLLEYAVDYWRFIALGRTSLLDTIILIYDHLFIPSLSSSNRSEYQALNNNGRPFWWSHYSALLRSENSINHLPLTQCRS